MNLIQPSLKDIGTDDLSKHIKPGCNALLLRHISEKSTSDANKLLISISDSEQAIGVFELKNNTSLHSSTKVSSDSWVLQRRRHTKELIKLLLWPDLSTEFTPIWVRWTGEQPLYPQYIHTLFWVDPDYRNTGIGKRLYTTYHRVEQLLGLPETREEITRSPAIIIFLVSQGYKIRGFYGGVEWDIVYDGQNHDRDYREDMLPALQMALAEQRQTKMFFHLVKPDEK